MQEFQNTWLITRPEDPEVTLEGSTYGNDISYLTPMNQLDSIFRLELDRKTAMDREVKRIRKYVLICLFQYGPSRINTEEGHKRLKKIMKTQSLQPTP
jgi:hypothetical protein